MRPETLKQAMDIPLLRAQLWADAITDCMARCQADANITRAAAFLANVAVESGYLQFVREIWGNTPAQLGYDRRADLGNTDPRAIALAAAANDRPGHFYRGMALIGVTGYANCVAASRWLFGDEQLAANPDLCKRPSVAAGVTAWFWSTHGCNELADDGSVPGFRKLVIRINGGLNGYADRVRVFGIAQRILAAA